MAVSATTREKTYRAYMEFFDKAERNRRWHWLDDVPWDKLDTTKNREETAICLETFCGVELYVPDYTANGFNLTREIFGHAWFQANWGYEESKHALVFREYLLRSGLRTLEQYDDYEAKIFAKKWHLPFPTRRRMTCYGALQELATYQIYANQREKYKAEGNDVLHKIFFLVSRDESAHYGFYRRVLQFFFEEDYDGTLADLAHVVYHFRMPGVGLIPEYDDRLKTEGVGITSQQFLSDAVLPMLRKLGTTRPDLVRALRQKRLEEQAQSAAGGAPSGQAA
ncbi:MAG: acyl-ACP desaturase [Proteobacteria bacterium]|nr:acyl-ACP desaturase [Pseudomonadota bacterium]